MNDRHEKWTPVEPGHVIPAGQPYRVEWLEDGIPVAQERSGSADIRADGVDDFARWFIDSLWTPPLELPTEPTWGIVRDPDGHLYGPYRFARSRP